MPDPGAPVDRGQPRTGLNADARGALLRCAQHVLAAFDPDTATFADWTTLHRNLRTLLGPPRDTWWTDGLERISREGP